MRDTERGENGIFIPQLPPRVKGNNGGYMAAKQTNAVVILPLTVSTGIPFLGHSGTCIGRRGMTVIYASHISGPQGPRSETKSVCPAVCVFRVRTYAMLHRPMVLVLVWCAFNTRGPCSGLHVTECAC